MKINEKEMLSKMTEDMECNKYDMSCTEVPYEVLEWVGGMGFSNYECNLDCRNCKEMEEFNS